VRNDQADAARTPANEPMKRTLNSAVQMAAVPFGINLFRLGRGGGTIQRRLSPIRQAAERSSRKLDPEVVSLSRSEKILASLTIAQVTLHLFSSAVYAANNPVRPVFFVDFASIILLLLGALGLLRWKWGPGPLCGAWGFELFLYLQLAPRACARAAQQA
jgi:hypothetical protein